MVGEDALPAPRRFLAGGSVEEEAEEGGASAVRRSIFECVARVNFILNAKREYNSIQNNA